MDFRLLILFGFNTMQISQSDCLCFAKALGKNHSCLVFEGLRFPFDEEKYVATLFVISILQVQVFITSF